MQTIWEHFHAKTSSDMKTKIKVLSSIKYFDKLFLQLIVMNSFEINVFVKLINFCIICTLLTYSSVFVHFVLFLNSIFFRAFSELNAFCNCFLKFKNLVYFIPNSFTYPYDCVHFYKYSRLSNLITYDSFSFFRQMWLKSKLPNLLK